ncbi:hypothetical protein [uncultured Treponema sp.]|uniref:hypothetical protein n=1 Tax=uncultured Treponema sp. TaxID=162155 RepID=UPI0025CE5810|nr:hypothetical protein [uncultured Treponema sp.]
MRKSFFVLTLVLFAVLPFISCSALSSDNSQSGLSVRLPSKNYSRAAKTDDIPQWANDIVTFEVSVESIPEDVFTQSKNAGWDETVSFEGLPVGSYKVTVLALNSEEKILGRGEEAAQVEEGKVSSVKISIKKYVAPVDEEPSGGNESGGLDVEIEFGGTASFNGEEYDSLAQALLAAKKASGLEIKTITLNGNVKENFVTSVETKDGKTVNNLPYYIQGDVIIDLNGKTLCWEEFTEDMKDDNNPAENPLFQVPLNYTLLIKNGTITSESGVKHSNILIGTTGGTIVLKDVEIKNVAAPYILSINNYAPENYPENHSNGSLYCENVTIKDCRGLAQSGTYGTSLGIPVSILSSEFYAQKMTIKDCVGESGLCGIVIQGDSSASFVGGGITLSKNTEISKMDGSALAILGGSLYVSSSTIFANSNYGSPVKVVNSGSLNLADGFEFKSFNEDSFEAESVLSNGSPYITADTLGLEKTENKIISAENENSTDSENIALILGKDSEGATSEIETIGALYVSGNSSIGGVIDLFMKSSIGVTGEITSNNVIKVKFEGIEAYASLTQEAAGDYPLFWAAGAENASDNREYATAIPDYFEIYGMSGYTIGDSGRKIKYAQGENNGNTIYAPVK